MSRRRQNNQLPSNLPQLQNLIKRDAESYREEFHQQLRRFDAAIKVFELAPDQFHADLDDLVMFLASVAKCYPSELSSFPATLFDLLRRHATVLDADMRMALCRSLILLRHKDLLAPADLLQLFFDLLRCPDKSLRKFLRDHIVTDLKNVNAKQKDVRLNSTMQNFMFSTLKESVKIVAKTSLDVMIELYRKQVWNDAKTVNVIATACFADVTKVMVTAIKFFLGNDDKDGDGSDDDSDDDVPTVREVGLANKVNKKTKKRQRFMENVKKAHQKKKKRNKVASFNFSALHLVHDPQGFAEKLLKKLDTLKEKFEVKLLFLDLISRLIGTHQLFVLNYYPLLARFLQPHQREVVQMLQFAAQASHELVPPDALEPVLRAVTNNFVTERNSSDVMAIGLNAVREICNRCPLVMDETLLRDLAMYKSYKDKSVMMAARSLIALFRTTHPELLHKKDRCRPTEAAAEARRRAYGEADAKDFVAGAEALAAGAAADTERREGEPDDDDDEEGWHDVEHSSEEEQEAESDDEGESDEVTADGDDVTADGDEVSADGDDVTADGDEVSADGKKVVRQQQRAPPATLEEKAALARAVTSSRILGDADFRRIDAAQLKKHVQLFAKGGANRKRKRLDSETPSSAGGGARQELVDIADIEMIHKKRKHDKETRLESIKSGREGREKFGSRKGKKNERSSTTNKEKLKQKNFSMMKHKIKKKTKRSFVDKQRDLKRSLLRQRKFK